MLLGVTLKDSSREHRAPAASSVPDGLPTGHSRMFMSFGTGLI